MPVTAVDLHKTLSLLSNMYLCKPAKDVIAGWRSALSEDIPDLLSDIKAALGEIHLTSEQEQEDLLWEYTRLFIGPYKLPCPPWESVYTSPKRLMMQAAFDEVADVYRKEGLILGDSGLMADHIGVELNFLALLLQRMKEDPGSEDYYAGTARAFIEQHLQKWVLDFTRDLEQAADYSLYKELARATGKIIAACAALQEKNKQKIYPE